MNGLSILSKSLRRIGFAAVAALVLATPSLAQQGPSEIDLEILYIRALGEQLQMPDYAELALQRVKSRFPDAGPRLKVIQIEQQLAQGKFDDVKAVIAAEPDKESPEVWAMRASMADYYYAFGRYDDAFGIYESLFKKFADKPPAELASFYVESMYKYAQMLIRTKKEKKALEIYEIVLKLPLDDGIRRQVQFEAAELMVNLAAEIPAGKDRDAMVKKARKACEAILWEQDLWFAKAVALLARLRVVEGNVEGAQKLVQGYLGTIRQIDDALMEQGRKEHTDYSRLSPVAQCRFLTGQMLYLEAKKILDAAGEGGLSAEDRARVIELLVGNGKKGAEKTTGAYQEFVNVYVKYPGANDAPAAMSHAEEIEEDLVRRGLVKSFKKNITPAQRAEVSRRQFENARVSFNEQDYAEAIERYISILNQYPREIPDTIHGISEFARCHIALFDPADPNTAMHEIYADTAAGHLAETFCSGPGMNDAGNELRAIAEAWSTEKGNVAKHDAVMELFFTFFPEHNMAAPLLWANTERAYKAEDLEGALAGYRRLADDYRKSPYSLGALSKIAEIQKKLENADGEIAAYQEMVSRLEEEGKPSVLLLTSQYQVAAAMRKRIHPEDLRSEEKEVADAAKRNLADAIKRFQRIQKILEDPAQAQLYAGTEEEKTSLTHLRESCYMGVAGSYASLASLKEASAAQVEAFRTRAIDAFESVLKTFPETENGARILNQVGTLWTAAAAKAPDDAARKDFNTKADEAFSRLSKAYPDSEEAKLALFMQGRALMELGFASEGREKFSQMLKDTSRYTPAQMLAVGEALRDGRQNDLALAAFEDAIRRANDEGVKMRASLGRALVLADLNRLSDSVTDLQKFVAAYAKSSLVLDANLQLSRSAAKLAAETKELEERNRLFKVSVGAMKAVRNYYTAKYNESDKRVRAATEADPPAQPEAEDVADLARYAGKLAETDNDIGDILILQSKAQEDAKDEDGARSLRFTAIAHFLPILDSFNASAPDAPERSPHVQKSFRTAIEQMMKAGEYGDAAQYAQIYLNTFPSGLYLSDIRSWLTEANAKK